MKFLIATEAFASANATNRNKVLAAKSVKVLLLHRYVSKYIGCAQ